MLVNHKQKFNVAPRVEIFGAICIFLSSYCVNVSLSVFQRNESSVKIALYFLPLNQCLKKKQQNIFLKCFHSCVEILVLN